eukprot:5467109-Prymnesium_polylepis.1
MRSLEVNLLYRLHTLLHRTYAERVAMHPDDPLHMLLWELGDELPDQVRQGHMSALPCVRVCAGLFPTAPPSHPPLL